MSRPRRSHDQRDRQRIRSPPRIEAMEPRGDRSHTERRGKIRRPDTAIEHRRAIDGNAEPDHRFVARDDGGGELAFIDLRHRRRNGQRRRHHDRAGRHHGGEMNVVDFAEPRQRDVACDPARQRLVGRIKSEDRPPLLGRGCRDPGADRVRDMQPQRLAGPFVDRIARNKGAELLKSGHAAT